MSDHRFRLQHRASSLQPLRRANSRLTEAEDPSCEHPPAQSCRPATVKFEIRFARGGEPEAKRPFFSGLPPPSLLFLFLSLYIYNIKRDLRGEKPKKAWGELLCSHTHKPHTKAHESFIPFPPNFTCGISFKLPSLVSPPPSPNLFMGLFSNEAL